MNEFLGYLIFGYICMSTGAVIGGCVWSAFLKKKGKIERGDL